MTKAMQQLLDRVSELPEDEQEKLALRFLEQLDDDTRWDELLGSSPELIDRMADEALREEDEGRTTELRFPRPAR
jgi:hypothetical protein